ncbi:MAG: DUF2089 domain-containing protein [Chloroflexi bacterium]|nr:DUF2089 domain-containing protein [Chloroflexota bacterium]
MTTSEERMKILNMIQEGKISAEEGMQLLNALDQVDRKAAKAEKADKVSGGPATARFFRVMVTDVDSGKTRVNVRLPISVVMAGAKMGARFSPEVEGLDIQQLMKMVESGATGKIVDVFDDQDGEHVEVFIE